MSISYQWWSAGSRHEGPRFKFPWGRGNLNLCISLWVQTYFLSSPLGFAWTLQKGFPHSPFSCLLSHCLQTVDSSLQCGNQARTENQKYNRILILHCWCCLINKHRPIYSQKRISMVLKAGRDKQGRAVLCEVMRNLSLIATFCPFVSRFWQCEPSASHSPPKRLREESRLLAENG